jgi:serine/threonine-protein kinase
MGVVVNVPKKRSTTEQQDDSGAGGERAESGVQLRTTRGAEPLALHSTSEAEWASRELDGRYRILGLLGEGAMGTMFLALHLALQKLVAIKVVPAELIGNGESVVRQTRAAFASVHFEHPHVVRANDCAALPEGGAYFVMQLVQGRALSELLAKGERVPWTLACELGAQIADALAAAESAGVVHRDLNPENILLQEREDGSDFVKIIDFGVAQAVPPEAVSVPGLDTMRASAAWARTVIGTPGYMAPEQAIGAPADHRSDLYALGVILWESIAGRTLWTGHDAASRILQQMREIAPPLDRAAPDPSRPAGLDRLVHRLLEHSPEARPAHAADVCEMLRSIADHVVLPVTEERAEHPPKTRGKRNAGRWLGAVALGCAATLCFGAYRWSTGERPAGSRDESPRQRVSATPAVLPVAPPSQSSAAVRNDHPRAQVLPAAQVEPAPAIPQPDASAKAPPVRQALLRPPAPATKRDPRKRTARPSVPRAARATPRPAAIRAEPFLVAHGADIEPLPVPPPANAAHASDERKAQASAEVRDLKVRGAVSTSVVRRAIERVQSRVAACYGASAGVASGPAEVEIEVAFDERGRVRDPRTSGASSPALLACVAQVAAGIILSPVPDTGLAKASWRVAFSSR